LFQPAFDCEGLSSLLLISVWRRDLAREIAAVE